MSEIKKLINEEEQTLKMKNLKCINNSQTHNYYENSEKQINRNNKTTFYVLLIITTIFFLIIFFFKIDLLIYYNLLHYNDILIPNYNIFEGFFHKSLLTNTNNKYKLYQNELCNNFDPFESYKKRINIYPIDICRSNISNHICYKNNLVNYVEKNGVICKMENVVIDPTKWKEDGHNYLGQIDNKTRGLPILEKGFFNMKCKYNKNISNYSNIYTSYFDSWNYNYEYPKMGEEELIPGKTIFFISRNQDSSNLFFGGAGIINAISMMHYFNLSPDYIQVIFLESMKIDDDPYYDLYKYVISGGSEPIHIRDLPKNYNINSAIYVPINLDSPCFVLFNKIPYCNHQVKAFYYLNDYINKYMNISNFIEPTNYNNETFYYPKSVINPNSEKYTKFVTFQWRKAWPKGRKGQSRLIGNGVEIIETLSKILPENFLVRLVDTGSLSMTEQISLMRKTDYFIGVHGAGLFLSVFMPTTSVLHEISLPKKTDDLILMSNLSGHRTFVSIWEAKTEKIDGCEYIYFDPEAIGKSVLDNMKKVNFFKN